MKIVPLPVYQQKLRFNGGLMIISLVFYILIRILTNINF